MKLLLHSADLNEVRQALRRGVISGVTTDPTLLAGLDAAAQLERLANLCAAMPGPVRAEVTAGSDPEAMVAQAGALARLAPNLLVGVPASAAGMAAVERCAAAGITSSVVGCRSPLEGLQAARAGAASVSLLVGDRPVLEQANLTETIRQLVGLLRCYGLATEVWVGPQADSGCVLDAAIAGAQATCTPWATLQILLSHPRRDGRPSRAA